MTSPNKNHPRCALTRALLILPLGLALSAFGQHEVQAQPAPSCAAALDQLMSEWRAIDFAQPAKPTQMIVAGRHGYATTGGQYNYMVGQIRSGARDCEAGRDADALGHINTVRGILDHASHI
jgi:hypothetical protein